MPFADVNGHQIAYEEHGPKDGPAVIFLHSFLMDRQMFAPQVEKLKSKYRCILMDERGHGETRAGGNFDFWDSAKDTVGLAKALGIEPAAGGKGGVVIVGISQGGFVALRCALLEPDLVNGAVVMGSSPDDESEENKVAFGQIFAGWEANGLESVIDTVMWVSLAGDKGVFKGDAEMTGKIRARMLKRNSEDDAAIFNALVSRDSIYEKLKEVKCPVIVLHGTDDHSYPVEKGKRICEGLPKEQLKGWVEVQGGAHFLSITDPEAVEAPLADFLAKYAK
ncbi:Alpha/Beta hydrolase protein [Hyaloraphidium curvatum]|nr:Alpha/Beta hydrolase protein [Hyaloraphidium curvatum]